MKAFKRLLEDVELRDEELIICMFVHPYYVPYVFRHNDIIRHYLVNILEPKDYDMDFVFMSIDSIEQARRYNKAIMCAYEHIKREYEVQPMKYVAIYRKLKRYIEKHYPSKKQIEEQFQILKRKPHISGGFADVHEVSGHDIYVFDHSLRLYYKLRMYRFGKTIPTIYYPTIINEYVGKYFDYNPNVKMLLWQICFLKDEILKDRKLLKASYLALLSEYMKE